MTAYLLDANVLIALVVAEHEHHDAVARWARTSERLALCPVVEGALVRFLVRHGESAGVAGELVRRLRADPRCEFWPDQLSYADADLSRVRGHRQVTDAYLVALASSRPDAVVATLDRGLACLYPEGARLVSRALPA